jgi:hypothetical protein
MRHHLFPSDRMLDYGDAGADSAIMISYLASQLFFNNTIILPSKFFKPRFCEEITINWKVVGHETWLMYQVGLALGYW